MGKADQLAIEVGTSLSNITEASSTIAAASSSLTSAATAFTIVSQKIAARLKELAEWEASLVERKRILDAYNEDLDQKAAGLEAKELEINTNTAALKELQEKWIQTTATMKSNIEMVADVVTLVIGGQKFMISKSAIMKHRNSYFTDFFQVDHAAKVEKVFIDRDPKFFGIIANYLREGKITEAIKLRDVKVLQHEFEFYRIPMPTYEIEDALFSGHSTLFDYIPEGLLTPTWKAVLQSWLPDHHFTLLYKASKDGFTSSQYHECCDAMGPTLVVIQSKEGYLFGGYIRSYIDPESPSQSEKHFLHSTSFLFTLSNPHTLPPKTYPLARGDWPTQYSATKHVQLGWGRWFSYDLEVNEKAMQSYSNFPYAFTDTTGKGKSTFTGTDYFTTTDVEIFSVLPRSPHGPKER